MTTRSTSPTCSARSCYTTARVGAAESRIAARSALRAINPDVEVVPIAARVQAEELDELVREGRHRARLQRQLRDAARRQPRLCFATRSPLVSGAAIRFDAQLMVFDLRNDDAPCYACLFPEDAEVEEVHARTMGVFAPLTGMIGAMQAVEAMKLIVGTGASLTGRLLIVDAASAEWRTVKVARDPACKVCG